MKVRSLMEDGFDKNVAEKMPKIKKLEETFPSEAESLPPPVNLDPYEIIHEVGSPEKHEEKTVAFQPPKAETEQTVDVLKLIEDLHTQLLVSDRIKKALEMDLHSYQKTVHQLTQDNQELRNQLEKQGKELQDLKEFQSESTYLKEENEDALERIRGLQQELREMNEALTKSVQERDGVLSRIKDLESQLEQNELLQIKGRLKEREASHFYEESQKLQSQLERTLSQNLDLERKYEVLKRSFNEVRESLTLLRDSCKKDYYNLSDPLE
jgi:DNA repair exonuclease SbcCD ATPase subunit